VNLNYTIFDGVFAPAIEYANALLGSDHQYFEDAIRPLVEHGIENTDVLGARTLKAIAIPLAYPGAVSLVMKGTIRQYGLGELMCFDGYGFRSRMYVEHVNGLPDDVYLDPVEKIAFLRTIYRYDHEKKRNVFSEQKVVSATEFGFRERLQNGNGRRQQRKAEAAS
jgi:hypothetical protein